MARSISGSSTLSRSFDCTSYTSMKSLGSKPTSLKRSLKPKQSLINQRRAVSSPAASTSAKPSTEWDLESPQRYCGIPREPREESCSLTSKLPGGWQEEELNNQCGPAFQQQKLCLALDKELEDEYDIHAVAFAPSLSESEEGGSTSDGREPEGEIFYNTNSGIHFQKLKNHIPPPGIAHSVFRLMERTIDPSKGQKKGFVYSASLEGCPGHVKIGCTSQEIDQRMSAINKSISCRLINIPDESYYSVRHFKRVERLIFADLSNERRKCKVNSTMHNEFFEIKEAKAHSCVKKWRDWMDQSPYDRNGRLHRDWRNRIDYFEANQANSKKLAIVHNSDQRWDPFMSPSLWTSLCIGTYAFLHGDRPSRGEAVQGMNVVVFLGVSFAALMLCRLEIFPQWMAQLATFFTSSVLTFVIL